MCGVDRAGYAVHSGDRTMSGARAVIFGCSGPVLTAEERTFFAKADPWGFILFARNIETPDQVRALTEDLRATVGRRAPILIDQEGGRVARLTAPVWQTWAPALPYCTDAGPNLREAMYLRGRMIAAELYDLGIDVNCAPILDVVGADTHAIIENRCYGRDPAQVGIAGRALADGHRAGGVLSIIKHIPGHGRGNVDSHFDLPRVSASAEELETTDFVPFRDLSDLPMAMTAHIVYEAIDPDAPATLSKQVVSMIRGQIGFEGLLMTDDLSMKALGGDFADRTRASLDAGCDLVLHCNGLREEMDPVAEHAPLLDGLALARAEAVLAERQTPESFDLPEAHARLNILTKG
ncbi:MAG: beta-N-acetylhexosaminidase, partial [Pseudomonadota bacterium]